MEDPEKMQPDEIEKTIWEHPGELTSTLASLPTGYQMRGRLR